MTLGSPQARALVGLDAEDLLGAAGRLTREGKGRLVTSSPKVFIPLTMLCRDVCHYCTFARPPRKGERVYLSVDEAVEIARQGAPGAGGGLPRGALHARRQARAALPRRARGARGARLPDDRRLPGARRRRGAAR